MKGKIVHRWVRFAKTVVVRWFVRVDNKPVVVSVARWVRCVAKAMCVLIRTRMPIDVVVLQRSMASTVLRKANRVPMAFARLSVVQGPSNVGEVVVLPTKFAVKGMYVSILKPMRSFVDVRR
jgi:hypothetical protein